MKDKLLKATKYVLVIAFVFSAIIMAGTVKVLAADGDTFTVGGLNYQVISESSKTAKVAGYTSVSANLEIPANVKNGSTTYAVTTIGRQAFANCTSLSKVILKAGIVKMEAEAFIGSSVTAVHIPVTLTSVDKNIFTDNGAFGNCAKLTTVTFDAGVTMIPERLFAKCTGLKSITIPDSVTEIKTCAFENCTSLSEVVMGKNVIQIGVCAFNGCSALQNITLPSTLNTLGYEAFSGSGLTSITIPKSLKTATENIFSDNGPFGNAAKLTSVTFENGLTEIPAYLFAGCTGIKEITLPASVTSIGSCSFRDCINLSKFTMQNNVTIINASVFRGDTALTNIVLSTRLKELGAESFYGSGLKSIVIPKSLTRSTENIFSDNGPFGGCTTLTSVTFEEGRTEILDNLFAGCTSITQISIPNTVKIIGENAFYKTKGITSISIPASVETIKKGAFEESGLKSVTIPKTVTKIESKTFANCTNLVSINMLANIDNLPSNFAFGCLALTSVKMEGVSLTSIGEKAFMSCISLKEIIIPKSAQRIDASVFRDCRALESIVIPSQVREIGASVFEDCINLKSATISAGVTQIKNYTFKNCGSLTTADIPYRVQKIGNGAFYNCYSLTNIAIPKSVTEIAADAFSYPGSMTINGIKGSFTQTFSGENDITFTTKAVATTGITLHNSKLLSSDTITAKIGESFSVIAAPTPVSSTQEVVWTSANPAVATVDASGTVKAVGGGSTKITAKSGNASASFTIKIQVPLTGLKLNQSSVTFNLVGGYTTLTATKNPTNTSETVVWASSNSSVATVDQNGKVVAKAVGTAVITACGSESSSVKASCNVTVKNIVLNAPTVTVTSTNYDKLKISWGKVANATGYQIYRYNSKTSQFEKIKDIAGGDVITYTNTGLGGYEYKYRVKAVVTSYGKTVYSPLSVTKAAKPKPNKVTGLKQSTCTATSISLKWSKQSGVSGYQIVKCSSANGTYTTAKTLASNSESYINSNCKAGTNYYYKVRAYKTNASGTKIYGDYSAPVMMTTKPAATTVSLSKASNTSIKIAWTKTTGSKVYEVYMATSKNGTYTKIKTVQSGSALSFTKTGLTKGKTYYFKIRSYKTNASGAKIYSGWSTIKSKSL